MQFRKVKELELRAIEDKKQMARVQEINNTLIKKINQNKSESEAKIANESKKAKSYKEIKASHKALIAENLDLKQDLCDAQTIIKVINKKYDSLLAASAEFEEKSSKMNKINEILKGHIRKLLQGSSFKLT